MGIRFAFDLGTNSIGWAVWRFGSGHYGPNTPLELLGAGVRTFGDGRNDASRTQLIILADGGARSHRNQIMLHGVIEAVLADGGARSHRN